MTLDYALHHRDDIDIMRQEKRIAWMYKYKDMITTLKRAKND